MAVRIRSVELSLLRHVLEQPVGGSGVAWVDVLLAQIDAGDGLRAFGFSYALGSSGVPSFFSACEIARSLLDAPDATIDPAQRWLDWARGFHRTGKGPNYLGLCALDVALWDLKAKAQGVPLWRCFGDTCPDAPLYQSAGFGAADTEAQTLRQLTRAADDGYGAVKLRIEGVPDDAPRVKAALRLAEDRGLRLMLDVNEKGRPAGFADFEARVRTLPIEWIEEPFPAGELRSWRALAAASPLPLAGGEHMQGLPELIPFVDERLLRVVQPDLAMMGGLSECLRVSREASRHGLQVAPHFLPGLFVHLAAAVPRLQWLEHFPLIEPLFDGWPVPCARQRLAPGTAPGHGLQPAPRARQAPVLQHERIGAR
ncbi:mandelate racemase/muconate lactonizing enzyme family protein [Variovorax sp. JS1663]|uniref:mandelate racemase/muconate lactonizing enzyme family protein n=1 Tax=Variovorax sp. JS1663 TaxID=1851577 RepID=UPI000B342984|nr:mandelate racemase/muconate lactonizing enzyme family protein [Variovorax sp. JS1663]OUM02442.1 hypothetical protein A8M77_10740 [Variovorax sp. JS1663]OUM02473.1 hypothetical protein A8M77_10905 [Variovorax sp. JS1663]